MKTLTQRERKIHAALLAEMADAGIPESRLMHVYHYQFGDDVHGAVESYIEARHDADEVAAQ